MIKPGFIAVFLGTALAIIIIVDGILKLQYAVDFYHLESDKWWIELIGAVVMVVVSVTKKAGKAIKNFKDQVDAVDMK